MTVLSIESFPRDVLMERCKGDSMQLCPRVCGRGCSDGGAIAFARIRSRVDEDPGSDDGEVPEIDGRIGGNDPSDDNCGSILGFGYRCGHTGELQSLGELIS